jgi:hypothetical protein
MNFMDSKNLGRGNLFGQKIIAAGKITYQIGVGGVSPSGDAFQVDVGSTPNASPMTYPIVITLQNGHFQVTNSPTKIAIGDVLTWHTEDKGTRGFSVSAQNTSGYSFDSTAMADNSVFTHVCGHFGVLEWTGTYLAGGTPKTVTGKITTTVPKLSTPAERVAYQASLAGGEIITLKDGIVDKPVVSITVGQTVFFAIQSSIGFSIVQSGFQPQKLRVT